jgi:hypothetical protein
MQLADSTKRRVRLATYVRDFAVDSRSGEGTTIEVIVPPEAIARAATESAAPAPEVVASIRASAE